MISCVVYNLVICFGKYIHHIELIVSMNNNDNKTHTFAAFNSTSTKKKKNNLLRGFTLHTMHEKSEL